MDRLTGYYSRLLHKLYAKIAAKGGNAKSHKTEFCREHGITARFFNGLANDVQGTIDGTRELLSAHRKDLVQSTRSLERRLTTLADKFDEIREGRKAVETKTFLRWRTLQGNLRRKLTRAKQKLSKVERRLTANVPGIGFGSRKLFKKQYDLKENGYRNRQAWLADWRAARAHQCFFLGSGDETGGNQSCTLSVKESAATNEADAGHCSNTLSLRIRLPDAVREPGEDKYLVLENLSFPCDEPALRAALVRSQALSWLIHRDHKGYRLMVSFARPAAGINTLHSRYGAIGVDFNIDHLAVTDTDVTGNLLSSRRIELSFEGKSTGQRSAILSDALEEVVEWALQEKKPIVVEGLDFEAKKKQMNQMSAAQARALSGLAYAKYQQLIASKCHRRGVQLLKVNPAHTSVMGRLKYARPKGLSVHQAAAGVIARRGQGFTERLPRAKELTLHAQGATLRFPVPARKDGQSVGAAWQSIGRSLGVVLRRHWTATRETQVDRCAKGNASGGASRPAQAEAPCPLRVSSLLTRLPSRREQI